MESIDKKTDVKAHTVKEQYRHRLTKGYEYYRVRLHSERKLPTSTNVDAVFNIAQVFPNHRADLLNGEWEVFLESFTADFVNVDKPSLTVQMPDLITSVLFSPSFFQPRLSSGTQHRRLDLTTILHRESPNFLFDSLSGSRK